MYKCAHKIYHKHLMLLLLHNVCLWLEYQMILVIDRGVHNMCTTCAQSLYSRGISRKLYDARVI